MNSDNCNGMNLINLKNFTNEFYLVFYGEIKRGVLKFWRLEPNEGLVCGAPVPGRTPTPRAHGRRDGQQSLRG